MNNGRTEVFGTMDRYGMEMRANGGPVTEQLGNVMAEL